MTDEIVIRKMSGHMLKKHLENGVSQYPKYDGRWLTPSGFKFSFEFHKFKMHSSRTPDRRLKGGRRRKGGKGGRRPPPEQDPPGLQRYWASSYRFCSMELEKLGHSRKKRRHSARARGVTLVSSRTGCFGYYWSIALVGIKNFDSYCRCFLLR